MIIIPFINASLPVSNGIAHIPLEQLCNTQAKIISQSQFDEATSFFYTSIEVFQRLLGL